MIGKVILYGTLALVGLSALGAKKAFDINDILPQLQTTLTAIQRLGARTNPVTGELEVTARINVAITNPTDKDLDIASAGAITIRKLTIYDLDNNLIAIAEPNINALSIVSGDTLILENILIYAPAKSTLDNIFSGLSTNPDDYTVVAEINALGATLSL